MVVVKDVQIGLIQVVEIINMMVIALDVLRENFLTMKDQR